MKLAQTVTGFLLAKCFRRPFYVRYQVSTRCNYRCRMCSVPDQAGTELTLDQVDLVAERLAGLGARHAVLTGGEPFLRPDLAKIIALFARRGFSVRVQTNGGPQVSYARLEECVDAGLEDLSVSIDTLDASLQDSICRARDVVPHALQTLAWARELMPRSISQANVVASAHNFAELPDLVRFFHARGIYTYITPAMHAPAVTRDQGGYAFRSSDAWFRPARLPDDVLDRVMAELIELRRQGLGLTNSERFLRDFRDYLISGKSAWRCEAGTLSLDVLADGGVTVCKEKPPLGNILDPEFPHRFRSARFTASAREVAEGCSLGCFYGEYREPMYLVRDWRVLWEWTRSYARSYRFGMRGPASEALVSREREPADVSPGRASRSAVVLPPLSPDE